MIVSSVTEQKDPQDVAKSGVLFILTAVFWSEVSSSVHPIPGKLKPQ